MYFLADAGTTTMFRFGRDIESQCFRIKSIKCWRRILNSSREIPATNSFGFSKCGWVNGVGWPNVVPFFWRCSKLCAESDVRCRFVMEKCLVGRILPGNRRRRYGYLVSIGFQWTYVRRMHIVRVPGSFERNSEHLNIAGTFLFLFGQPETARIGYEMSQRRIDVRPYGTLPLTVLRNLTLVFVALAKIIRHFHRCLLETTQIGKHTHSNQLLQNNNLLFVIFSFVCHAFFFRRRLIIVSL